MADIAFLLLIFFMLSSIMEMEKEIPVKLPESRISVQEKGKYFNIWIDENGDYFFDNRKDSSANLATFARYKLASNPDTTALIRAEKDIPYEFVNAVMESLKEAGLHSIVLVSRKKQ